MTLTFVVPGKPSPKKRPRLAWKDKYGNTFDKPHRYTPDDFGYVPQVQAAALRAMGGMANPTAAPVVLTLLIYRLMPKSWSLKKQKDMRGQLTTVRPDPINIAMNYCDALTGYCWNDDSQVHLVCQAWWSDRDEVHVQIEEATG